MKIKTSELSGAALDWAVAQCLIMSDGYRERGLLVHRIGYGQPMPAFSTDWSQGGPIIDREDIDLWKDAPGDFAASIGVVVRGIHGPTKLIAATRCFVASKLGDEVDVPEELCQ